MFKGRLRQQITASSLAKASYWESTPLRCGQSRETWGAKTPIITTGLCIDHVSCISSRFTSQEDRCTYCLLVLFCAVLPHFSLISRTCRHAEENYKIPYLRWTIFFSHLTFEGIGSGFGHFNLVPDEHFHWTAATINFFNTKQKALSVRKATLGEVDEEVWRA